MASVATGRPAGGTDFAFVVQSDGKQFVADVGRFASSAANIRPALEPHVRNNVRNAMGEVFRLQGAPLRRGRWASLSNSPWRAKDGRMIRPGYRDWKTGVHAGRWQGTRGDGSWWAYRGPRGTHWPTPLSLSGRMHESLTTTRGKGSAWVSWDKGFLFGTTTRSSRGFDYPAEHAKGNARMPRRSFLDWDVQKKLWRQAIMAPVAAYLVDLARGTNSLAKYGTIDVSEFTREWTAPGSLERRGRG